MEDVGEACPVGAICEADGSALETLELRPGRWREHSESVIIRRCLNPDACEGGTETGDDSCAPGYTGPRWAVGEAGWAPGENYQCYSCDSSGYKIWVFAAPSTVVLILFNLRIFQASTHPIALDYPYCLVLSEY